MILDTHLELLTSWKPPIVGPSIGGTPPTIYGYDQSFPQMRFYTNGPAYSDWLAANARPVLPNTGFVTLSFQLMIDGNVANAAQALEFDTRISVGGWNYNFSSQINIAAKWQLQISGADGGWANTGFTVPTLAPSVWHTFSYSYWFNTTTQKYSIISVTIDGAVYVIPPSLQNLSPQNLGWSDSCSIQVQQDLGSKGGAFSQLMRNIQYAWS